MRGEDGTPARQVGPVEVRVDHDDVRRRGRGPGVLGEAPVPRGAAERAGALPRTHAHHRPGARVGLERQVGPVTCRRLLGPPEELAHLVGQPLGLGGRVGPRARGGHFLARGPVVDQRGLIAGVGDLAGPLAAQVVVAALEHGEGERSRQPLGHRRQVLVRQLVLQRLGRRRHHHLAPRDDGRYQVGKGFSRAGARLNHQVAPGVDGPGHRTGHLELLGSDLTRGEPTGDALELGRRGVLGVRARPGHRPRGPGRPGVTGRIRGRLHAPIMPRRRERPGAPGRGRTPEGRGSGSFGWWPVLRSEDPGRGARRAALARVSLSPTPLPGSVVPARPRTARREGSGPRRSTRSPRSSTGTVSRSTSGASWTATDAGPVNGGCRGPRAMWPARER